MFSLGDGNRTIEDWGGLDTLTLASGIDATDLVISRVANDLRLTHVNGSGRLQTVRTPLGSQRVLLDSLKACWERRG